MNIVTEQSASGIEGSVTNRPAHNTFSARPKALLVGKYAEFLDHVWAPEQRRKLAKIVDLECETWDGDAGRLPVGAKDVEILFSTWGMPSLSWEQLQELPRLRAVFYAAGSVKEFADPFFERDIRVFSAWAANAVPVAEFTLSQILFALKQGWLHHRQQREKPGPDGWKEVAITGSYGANVGIVSLGMIGRKVAELLEPFHLRLLAYDPLVSAESMRKLNLNPATLEELFAASDVVSLHAPWLKETEGMVTGKLLRSMKKNATFINTARGALVREDELIEVMCERPDLTAVLDVTFPEPPLPGSRLYTLHNVVLTPHIAGSKGAEVRRMADWMLDECAAWLSGRPTQYEVTADILDRMA